jgi:hypothetical protein
MRGYFSSLIFPKARELALIGILPCLAGGGGGEVRPDLYSDGSLEERFVPPTLAGAAKL